MRLCRTIDSACSQPRCLGRTVTDGPPSSLFRFSDPAKLLPVTIRVSMSRRIVSCVNGQTCNAKATLAVIPSLFASRRCINASNEGFYNLAKRGGRIDSQETGVNAR